MSGDEEFDLDDNFTFIAFFNYFEFGGATARGIPLYIKQHPYYPTFKKKVKEIPLEKIPERLETYKTTDQ